MAILMDDKDLLDLKKAKALLEKDGIAIKIANFFGKLIEMSGKLLSPKFRESVALHNVAVIEKSWEFTMTTMSGADEPPESVNRHLFYVIISGAVGGVGILTLIIELPVTTVLMLRSVADIAKDEGEDYNQFETKIASLQVLALGSDFVDENTGETGYYAIRMSLEKPMLESSKHIAKKGAAGMGAPFAVQLIAKIAVRFQTVLSAQIAATVVPVAGAITGAIINIIFINLFQDKARGHFIVRRLEKKYGPETVKRAYLTIGISDDKKIYDQPVHKTASVHKNEFEPSKSKLDGILRHHVWASFGVGLIPLPIADFVGITVVQLALLKNLANAYNAPFSRGLAKNIMSTLVGGALPASISGTLAASITKFIPAIGQTIGTVTMPIIAGAATYAIGKVFIQHFASGGTFLTFDPEKVKGYYAQMFEQGKKIATDIKQLKTA